MSEKPPFELFPWQKRQAALLYHFASLEYLKGLKPQIDELIAWTDTVLDDRSGLDAIGLAELNWAPSDTAANFSTHAFPALVEFQESTARDIAQRAFESYDITGAHQCARMLQEYGGQMIWATPEQAAEFKERFERIYKYASEIDYVMQRPPTLDDSVFRNGWLAHKQLFPKLPKFKVRTDVESVTDAIPPRTGVYVPQDDPYGALQFRWTGGGYGELCECVTFSAIGLDVMRLLGWDSLFDIDQDALFQFSQRPEYRSVFKDYDGNPVADAEEATYAVLEAAYTRRPCKWYYVELVNDEYEDHDGTYAGTLEVKDKPVQRSIPAGQPCPRSGWWHTPARSDSRRRFTEGEVFPAIENSDYGATFWLWDENQSAR